MKIKFLLLLLLSMSIDGYAQPVQRQELEVAYIYSFSKHIDWEKSSDNFRIAVISEDPKLLEEFRVLASQRTIDKRNIEIIPGTSNRIPEDAEIVFIKKEFDHLLKDIFDNLAEQKTLIISDRTLDRGYTMINLIDVEEQGLSFEINPVNLSNWGFVVHPELILLGGSEMNVAQLYKGLQDSARVQFNRLEEAKVRLDSLAGQISESYITIANQKDAIALQNKDIQRKQNEISLNKKSVDSIQQAYSQSFLQLATLSAELSKAEGKLELLDKDLSEQSEQL